MHPARVVQSVRCNGCGWTETAVDDDPFDGREALRKADAHRCAKRDVVVYTEVFG